MDEAHHNLVKALVKPAEQIHSELTQFDCQLIHMSMGISGEAGELLDAIKKCTMYHQPLDMENVIEEIGDIEFYLEGLRQHLGLTREQTLAHNYKKLRKRYYDGQFSNEAAKTRADKVGETQE